MAGIKTQGTDVKVQTALASTKVITGATQASPCVVTAVAHGYSNGDIVKVQNVVGMTELNDRAFVVSASVTDAFTLKGVDSTGYTAYVSGGDSYKATMTSIAKVDGVPSLFAGQAATIDSTHLKSVRTETQQGLAQSGSTSLSGIIVDADAGQAAMDNANEAQAALVYTVTRSDAKVACMVAFCDSFVIQAAKNEIYRWTASLTLSAARTKFA